MISLKQAWRITRVRHEKIDEKKSRENRNCELKSRHSHASHRIPFTNRIPVLALTGKLLSSFQFSSLFLRIFRIVLCNRFALVAFVSVCFIHVHKRCKVIDWKWHFFSVFLSFFFDYSSASPFIFFLFAASFDEQTTMTVFTIEYLAQRNYSILSRRCK